MMTMTIIIDCDDDDTWEGVLRVAAKQYQLPVITYVARGLQSSKKIWSKNL
jgi:hypothetical protein